MYCIYWENAQISRPMPFKPAVQGSNVLLIETPHFTQEKGHRAEMASPRFDSKPSAHATPHDRSCRVTPGLGFKMASEP